MKHLVYATPVDERTAKVLSRHFTFYLVIRRVVYEFKNKKIVDKKILVLSTFKV